MKILTDFLFSFYLLNELLNHATNHILIDKRNIPNPKKYQIVIP